MSELVYLNGEFLPKENATISPNDRGFVFADGVYEVIKYYNGKPFRYEDHLARLKRSLNEVQIGFKNLAELEHIFHRLLNENNLAETQSGVYLQISRGANKRVHNFPAGITPTVYAFAFPMPSFTEKLEKGISVITREDIRWLRCDIKSVALLPNTMLYNQAVESGAGECILIRDGKVTEATHSSVLAVKDGTVITHPLSNLILPGITRKVILEICGANNIPVEERAVSEKELFDVDELIIAGTGSEITPVIQVNNTPVGNKKPGEITRLLQHKFFEMV
ncbi:D-alanine transaminase [Mariniphaga anaerophila]|uniref:D-alanine aminotransferase n=1 Tax=Mariniphaga anaerophila TaxID=1484053 RepID=A0A1M4TRK1_9BACT|nr:D-amino-acid transaminase [Mariniphaga anaerophila]SHE47024.1 D-alanine transaminase [Mariniphaga anaerophila]